MSDTLLVIASPALITPFAARGLVQTLEPIAASAQVVRDVNGNAVDLSVAAFRKYRSTITCRDMNVPALDGVWPGEVVTVDCVVELSYLTSGGTPTRTVVSGSSRTQGDYTFYRPQLSMIIVLPPSVEVDEWGAEVAWSLELEEA